jgi:TRIAP1/MDM35 family protein
MQSIGEQCTELKKRYEECFHVWYSEKFLKGIGTHEEDPCKNLLREYQVCILDTLKQKNLTGPLKEHGHDIDLMAESLKRQEKKE